MKRKIKTVLRSVRQIWWLTIVVVASAGAAIYLMSDAMQRLDQELKTQMHRQSDLDSFSDACIGLVEEASQDCFEVLHSPGPPKPTPEWINGPMVSLSLFRPEECRKHGIILEEHAVAFDQIVLLYQQTQAWAEQSVKHRQDFLVARKNLQVELNQLATMIREQSGKAQLAIASAVRTLPESPASSTQAVAESLAQHSKESAYWNRVNEEIDDLTILFYRIQTIENFDKFNDFRDNAVASSLRRLHGLLQQLDRNSELYSAFITQLDRFELALIGGEFHWNEQSQSLELQPGSFLHVLSEKYRLEQENRALAEQTISITASIYDSVNNLRSRIKWINQHHQADLVVLVNNCWSNVWAISAFGLATLLFFSIGLPISLKKHVRTIQEAYDEIVRQEQQLRKQDERFTHATSNAKLGIWEFHPDSNKIWVNKQWLSMVGKPADSEVQGFDFWANMVAESDRMRFRQSLRSLLHGAVEDWNVAYQMRGADGATHWMRTIGRITERDATGRPTLIAGIQIDETDRKEMETKLARSSRHESVGQLAAGVAHEINTPTQFASHQVTFLQEAFVDLIGFADRIRSTQNLTHDGIEHYADEFDIDYLISEVPRAARQSLEGLDRIARIVRSLKDFVHPNEDVVTFDVCAIIRSTVDMSVSEWRNVAQLNQQLPPDGMQIEAIPSALGQVLLNLIVNATHAIQEKQRSFPDLQGVISVTASDVGDEVEIIVSDNGCGMSEETQRKMFDPFFTTKGVGQGTGQGLSLVHRILQRHHASITVLSNEGEGTTMRMRFPKVHHAFAQLAPSV